MKLTSTATPRLSCRAIRGASFLFEGLYTRHVAGCADCRVYVRAADALDLQLRNEAVLLRKTSAAESTLDLEQSILRAVNETRRAAPRRRAALPLWAMGAATAGLAAVVVAFQVWPNSGSRSGGGVSLEAVAIVEAVENLSAKFTGTVIPSAGAMVANNPLQRELGSVYSDARSALDFLALNFLPTTTVSAAPTAEKRI